MTRLLPLLPVLLTACVATADTAVAPGYRLVSLDGQPFAATATLAFAEGSVGGDGPCNRWSARLLSSPPAFRIGPVIATERACPDLAAEQDVFLALATMTRAEISGDTLTLTSPDGLVMVFRAIPN
jgi:heat shock protein HslJ